MPLKKYIIEKRWMPNGEGWKFSTGVLNATFEDAAQTASDEARRLDKEYGNSHFWTVDLKTPDGASYFQLFHGRLA